MSVYERADSPYWWMHIPTAPAGQRKQSTKILKGVTAAERKESRAKADREYHKRSLKGSDVQHGEPVNRDTITFGSFAAWYDTNHIEHHKGKERERTILPRLVTEFGPLALTDPTWHEQAVTWRTRRRATPTVIKHFGGPKGKKRILPPPSARTVNREMDLLQQILSAAVVAGYLDASPIYGLENLDIVKPIRRTLGAAEEKKLAAELSPEDYAIFLVGLDALARLGDILDLQRSDDHGETLDIRDPKNGDPLTVPVSSRLRRALDRVPLDPAAPDYYFPGRRGACTERDRRGGYAKALQRACERAGVPYGRKAGGVTFHWATRRTGATRMIRQGGEKAIGVTQAIGGWKDPTVLIGIYQETITAEMRAAVETVAPKRRRAKLQLVPEKRKKRASAVT